MRNGEKKRRKSKRTKQRGSRKDTSHRSPIEPFTARALKLRKLVLGADMNVGAALASLETAGEMMRELCREIGFRHAAADDVEYAAHRARISKRTMEELSRAVGLQRRGEREQLRLGDES